MDRRLFRIAALLAWVAACPVNAQQVDEAYRSCIAAFSDKAGKERRMDSCTQVISRNGENSVKLAHAYAMRGWAQPTYAQAIEDFSAALERVPDLDQALVGRAIAYLNSKQSERAIPDYTRLLSKHPNEVQLLIGRGDAFNNLKRYGEGVADFDRALALQPDNEEAINDRAWALARQGRFADAIKGYDRALSVSAKMRDIILSNRCDTKSRAGDLAGAVADCEAALALKPGEPWHRVGRGIAYFRGGKFDKAIADYDAALALNPNEAGALYARGVARLRLGKDTEGRQDLQKAVATDPQIRDFMVDLGISE